VYSRSLARTLVGTLPFVRPLVWLHFCAALATAMLLLRVARHAVPGGRLQRRLGLVAAVAVFAGAFFTPASYRRGQASIAASAPEHLYLATIRASFAYQLELTRHRLPLRPQQRAPLPVPPLSRASGPPRNVLLVLQESQRVDVTCIEYDRACERSTRASNRAAPGRLPLLQARAQSSATTLSCSTLWTGLSPAAPEQALLSAPTLWSFAAAAGYSTAYVTSQHLVFENLRHLVQDEPLDLFACATTLDPAAELDVGASDARLTDWIIHHWDELEEPFFAVAHYSNQHHPYVNDASGALFDLSGLDPHHFEYADKRYRNAVYLSDLAVGRLIEHVRSTEAGTRTVIVYTADHAEAFGEHGLAGHTFSVWDNEIHVPAWIDAPAGTLSEAERANVAAARNLPVFHTDFAPTLLDLIGVWDTRELEPFRAAMPGRPLLRPLDAPPMVPLTNCSRIWECQQASWGLMQGTRKLAGTQGQPYRCFDVATDPKEVFDLGAAACADLQKAADQIFPRLEDTTAPHTPRE
jgi:arylsulfatase A-like enzyme